MFEESVTSIPSIWASMNSWFTPTVLFLFLNVMIGTIYVTSSLATQKSHHEDRLVQPHHHQLARSPSVLQRLKSINFRSYYRSPEPAISSVTLDRAHQFDSVGHTHFSFQQSPSEVYHQNQPFLSRSPSILQRIKSINLQSYFTHESAQNQETQTNGVTTNFGVGQDLQERVQEQTETPEEEEEEEGENVDGIQDQEQTFEEIYSKLKSKDKVSMSQLDTKPTSVEVPKRVPKKMKKSASSKTGFSHSKEEDVVESRRPATVREGKSSSRMHEVDDAEVDAKADDFIYRFKQQLKLQRIDSIIRYKEKGASE